MIWFIKNGYMTRLTNDLNYNLEEFHIRFL